MEPLTIEKIESLVTPLERVKTFVHAGKKKAWIEYYFHESTLNLPFVIVVDLEQRAFMVKQSPIIRTGNLTSYRAVLDRVATFVEVAQIKPLFHVDDGLREV